MQKNLNVIKASKWLCISIFLLSAYLLLKYAMGIFLPFLIAFLVGAIVYPISVKTAKVTHLPRKLCAVITVLLLLILFGIVMFFTFKKVFQEVTVLIDRATDESDPIGAWIKNSLDMILSITERIPFLKDSANKEKIAELLSNAARSAIASLGKSVTSVVGRVVTAMPKVALSLIVTIIACFYASCDLDKIKAFLFSILPKERREAVCDIFRTAVFSLRVYVKAYPLLFLLTFSEVLAGLLILRRPYAFLWAIIIAIVDILPIFGAGTVLIPWSVFLFLSGRYSLGCGMLILYGTVTVIRQIAEPHLVGKGLGIHPLATLFCMFAGFRLFGVIGLLTAPAAALIIKGFLK